MKRNRQFDELFARVPEETKRMVEKHQAQDLQVASEWRRMWKRTARDTLYC